VAKVGKKILAYDTYLRVPLPCSQQVATGTYPKLSKPNKHPYIRMLKMRFNIILAFTPTLSNNRHSYFTPDIFYTVFVFAMQAT
jgi:hypothetical protein